MTSTEDQRRWWFATHPEYSWSRTGRRLSKQLSIKEDPVKQEFMRKMMEAGYKDRKRLEKIWKQIEDDQSRARAVAGALMVQSAIAGARAILAAAYLRMTSRGKAGPLGGASEARSGNLWSSGKLSAGENAAKHWKDHGAEFPNLRTPAEYVQEAHRFLNSPPRGALTKIAQNGDVIVYHPMTNTFGVRTADGTPRTMFKPRVGQHEYRSNLEYFYAQ